MSTHTIKGLRAEFKAQGKFHTPPALAQFLRDLIPQWETVRDVYDPTCGAGALLAVFPQDTPKYGQDVDLEALNDATTTLTRFHGIHGDTLTQPAFLNQRFHAIVANPPFSIKWQPHVDERFENAPTIPTQGKADYAFLLHILHMLADDGTAAVLQFPGVLYRGGREGQLRQWMIENNYIDTVIQLPGKTFEDTTISTCALVLRKNRAPGAPIHMEDREKQLTRDVPITEIAANDYTLSVGTYLQEPEPEREPVDPWQLELQCQDALINNLRNGLMQSRFVCALEGWDFEPLRQRALKVVEAA